MLLAEGESHDNPRLADGMTGGGKPDRSFPKDTNGAGPVNDFKTGPTTFSIKKETKSWTGTHRFY